MPPSPRDRRIGPVGAASPCVLPLVTMRPSESRKLIWNDCRSASMPLGAPGTGVLVEARGIWPDEAGHEDLEPVAVGRHACDRDGGLLGSVKLQGADRHDGGKFRLRRVPWTRHLTL